MIVVLKIKNGFTSKISVPPLNIYVNKETDSVNGSDKFVE